jgi:hypothetical protein
MVSTVIRGQHAFQIYYGGKLKLKLSFILILLCICSLKLQAQSVLSGTSLVLDSVASNPSAPNSAYQTKMFLKSASPNGVGLYAKHRSAVWRIDSSYTFTDTNRAFQRQAVVDWMSLSATDSVLKIYVPSGRSITIDSVYSLRSGGSSATYRLKKIHSGSTTYLFSSQSIGTSIAAGTSISNNTGTAYDQFWVIIDAISGTPSHIWIVIHYHFSS